MYLVLDEPTWLVVVVVVRWPNNKDEKNPPRLAIANEGVGGFTSEGTNPQLTCYMQGCHRRVVDEGKMVVDEGRTLNKTSCHV